MDRISPLSSPPLIHFLRTGLLKNWDGPEYMVEYKHAILLRAAIYVLPNNQSRQGKWREDNIMKFKKFTQNMSHSYIETSGRLESSSSKRNSDAALIHGWMSRSWCQIPTNCKLCKMLLQFSESESQKVNKTSYSRQYCL